jgi:hypothetical protein
MRELCHSVVCEEALPFSGLCGSSVAQSSAIEHLCGSSAVHDSVVCAGALSLSGLWSVRVLHGGSAIHSVPMRELCRSGSMRKLCHFQWSVRERCDSFGVYAEALPLGGLHRSSVVQWSVRELCHSFRVYAEALCCMEVLPFIIPCLCGSSVLHGSSAVHHSVSMRKLCCSVVCGLCGSAVA